MTFYFFWGGSECVAMVRRGTSGLCDSVVVREKERVVMQELRMWAITYTR